MTYLGAMGYGTVGILYAVICVLSATSWSGGRIGGLFILACAMSAVWGGIVAVQSVYSPMPALPLFCAEVLRGGLWINFLVALDANRAVGRGLRAVFQMAWMALLICGIASWVALRYFGVSIAIGTVMIPGGLVIALAGLMLIEQLYRNSVPEARWNIKTLALGLGGMFAYDLFLYSQGVLFGSIDELVWTARGAVNVLFVPMIAIAARRNAQWDLDIFVSRHVVFYTTTLVAVGVYLILMSLGGYAILLYGGSWGALVQVLFLVGALLVLAALLFSNKLRARAKVFLSKHFFRNKYDYRDEWLRLISTLAGFEDSSTRQIVIKALAQIVDSPGGLLWTLDESAREYRPASAYNIDASVPVISADDPMMQFIGRHHWLIDLEEYRANPELYDNAGLPEWLTGDERAWLVVPLVIRQSVPGLVMLQKARGALKLNYEDRDLLKTVGHHIAVHLAQESSDNLLAQAQQFEAYNRLTAFLMHDLNNLIAQQSLIVKNAERHKRNPEFVDDAMQTIAGSVARMKRVMDQLKRGETEPSVKKTVLKFLVSAAVDRCAGRAPEPEIDLTDSDIAVEVDAERFVMVLTHLIKNAQDATPEDGQVTVSTECDARQVNLTVADTGCGMSPDFIRDRLFRPFDSTKGSQGMGIGAYQAREFARALGGDLKVLSEPGQGSTVILSFPRSDAGQETTEKVPVAKAH